MQKDFPPDQSDRTDPDVYADEYGRYADWKGWNRFFEYDAEDAEYFLGELRDLPSIKGRKVLEIGFGTGSFLAWARAKGASVAGIEVNGASLRAAERQGVELLPPAIELHADAHKERFDLVVAFDVFEHFDISEIRSRIRAVETMLKPGGCFILRFPNGQSPFGLPQQNGDVTHKTALSKDRVMQLCEGTRFAPTRYKGAYCISGRFGVKVFVRIFRAFAQSMIGAVLNTIFALGIPWQGVVVLVLRKESVTGPVGPAKAERAS